jgi:DNA-binding LacI/PurR family transcriptional regulator
MGFDDHFLSSLLDLSTIRQPVADQARELTERLLARVAGEEPEDEVSVLPTELVVRGSTDPTKSVY